MQVLCQQSNVLNVPFQHIFAKLQEHLEESRVILRRAKALERLRAYCDGAELRILSASSVYVNIQ